MLQDKIDIKWRDFGLDVHVHNLDIKTETTALASIKPEICTCTCASVAFIGILEVDFDDISIHHGEFIVRDMTSSNLK